MNCLERSLAKCSGGTWLQDYSYVVLEHGMVDKKCGVCRNHNYTNLEQTLHGKRRQHNLCLRTFAPKILPRRDFV